MQNNAFSFPTKKVQQWHDPIPLVENNKIKISINSVSQVTGQFTVSIKHPVKGVRETTAKYKEILKEHLGTSS